MRARRFFRTAALLLAAALPVAACDSSTEPDPAEIDADAALEDYQAFQDLVESVGWSSLQAMGNAMVVPEGAAVAPSTVANLLSALSRPGATEVPDLHVAPPAAAPIISDLHRGSTFAWSESQGRYLLDPDRVGAPSNGVRFIVYEELPGGAPDPDTEVGWADLTDLGDGSAEDVVLRLEVVVDDLTRLDYRTTVDQVTGGAVVTVDGFLQDETDRLDFDIDVSGSGTIGASALDVAFEMRMDSRDFSIDGQVSGTGGEAGETGEVDITVRHGERSLRVDVEGTDTTIEGVILLDGSLFATVSGHPDDPVFTGADGQALTLQEISVLLRVMAVVADTLSLFFGLVAPVGPLVLLGVIL